MFGSEQSVIQSKMLKKILYRIIGEFTYPLRLRNFYLWKSLPPGFSPKSIWDIGSGSGQTSFFLAHHYPTAKVIGTDLNVKIVGQCGQIAQLERMKRIRFEYGDLIESRYENAFDLIVCLEVLEHIKNYKLALQRLAIALRPGGYLIIHTPASGRFQSQSFGIRRFVKTTNSYVSQKKGQYHIRPGFLLNELVDSLERHDLIVEKKNYTFGPLAMHSHTIFELTRSYSILKVITFPLLILIGVTESYFNRCEGGGLLLRARKMSQ
jgi:2-polyprenyl-3-methyl-5-hydroxy-6-metoxy-1,4-benzoquinol methylase